MRRCFLQLVFWLCHVTKSKPAYFMCNISRTRNQLGTTGAAKSFLRRAQNFKLCPMVLTYAQHVFPGGGEKFCRGFLVTGLNICLKSNTQKSISSASKFSTY